MGRALRAFQSSFSRNGRTGNGHGQSILREHKMKRGLPKNSLEICQDFLEISVKICKGTLAYKMEKMHKIFDFLDETRKYQIYKNAQHLMLL